MRSQQPNGSRRFKAARPYQRNRGAPQRQRQIYQRVERDQVAPVIVVAPPEIKIDNPPQPPLEQKVDGLKNCLNGLSRTAQKAYKAYVRFRYDNTFDEITEFLEGKFDAEQMIPKVRERRGAEEFINLVGSLPIKTFVDVGSGDGRITDEITKHFGCATFTIDVEETKYETFDFDRQIDLLIISHSLHHMEPDEQIEVLTDLISRLSVNGILIIKEHDVRSPQHLKKINFVHSIWNLKTEYPCNDNLICRSKSEWIAMVLKINGKLKELQSTIPSGFGRTFLAMFGRPSAKRSISKQPIRVHSVDLETKMISRGFATHRVAGTNSHENGAAIRQQVIVSLFRSLQAKHPKMTKIALLYDWNRLEPSLLKDSHGWLPSVFQRKITIRDYQNGIPERFDDLSECSICIIHDQYDGMTPDHLNDYFNLLAPGAVIYVVLTPMFAKAGVIADMAYYDDGERVTCSADMFQSYFHKSEEFPRWLNDEPVPIDMGNQVLHSTLLMEVDGKCVFSVMRLHPDVLRVPAGAQITSLIETRIARTSHLKFNYWRMRNEYMEDTVELLVCRPVYDDFFRQYQESQTTPWNYATLGTAVHKEFSSDKDWLRWSTRFPDVAKRVVKDTERAIMYIDKAESIIQLEELAGYNRPFEQRYAQVMKKNAPVVYISWTYKMYRRWIFGEELVDNTFKPNPNLVTLPHIGLCVLGALILRKTFFGSIIPSAANVADNIGSEVVEEAPLVPFLSDQQRQDVIDWYGYVPDPEDMTWSTILSPFISRIKDKAKVIYDSLKQWYLNPRAMLMRNLDSSYAEGLASQTGEVRSTYDTAAGSFNKLSLYDKIRSTIPINPIMIYLESISCAGKPLKSILIHVACRWDIPILQRVFCGLVGALPFREHYAWNCGMYFGLEAGLFVWLGQFLFKRLKIKDASDVPIMGSFLPWRTFSDCYNQERYHDALEVSGSGPIPIGERLLSTHAHPTLHKEINTEPQHSLIIKHRGITSDVMPQEPRVDVITPVLITQAILHAPTPGLNSLNVALKCRNMQTVPEPAPLEEWSYVLNQMSTNWPVFEDGLDISDLNEWADHFTDGRKKAMANDLVTKAEEGEIPFAWHGEKLGSLDALEYFKLSMFAKRDETLPLKTTDDGNFGVKPRTIICLPLALQLHTQPWVRRASKNLKNCLKEPFYVNGVAFHFTYAGGMNSADLDDWLEAALHFSSTGGVAGIFMGDDSLIIDGKNDMIVECDYSHFDQSQHSHLIDFDSLALNRLGVPLTVTEILEKVASSHSTAKRTNLNKDTTIKFKPGFARRCSGSPNTAISNSINNMVAMIIACFGLYSMAVFNFIGFKTKIQFHTSIRDATFLKGKWWKSTQNALRWATLPSRVLKLGKVGCVLKNELDVLTMGYAIAQNLGEISNEFPILGAFRRALVRNSGTAQKERLHEPKFDFGYAEHRIRNQIFDVDRDEAINDMMARYHLTLEDILEMEAQFDAVETLPYFVAHRGYARLRFDY